MRLRFDGMEINESSTCEDLDIEDGDIVDVIVLARRLSVKLQLVDKTEFVVQLNPDQPFTTVFEYLSHQGYPNVRLQFDGQSLKPNDTCEKVDVEDEDVIDVVVLQGAKKKNSAKKKTSAKAAKKKKTTPAAVSRSNSSQQGRAAVSSNSNTRQPAQPQASINMVSPTQHPPLASGRQPALSVPHAAANSVVVQSVAEVNPVRAQRVIAQPTVVVDSPVQPVRAEPAKRATSNRSQDNAKATAAPAQPLRRSSRSRRAPKK